MPDKESDAVAKGFSILLKRLRREVRGWTQKQLASQSGLKVRTIVPKMAYQFSNIRGKGVARIF